MFFSGQNQQDTKLYEVLNVSKDASLPEIKKSYRKLAMKYHPDRNMQNKEHAESKFKEISYAYDVLSDPEKKSKYDQFGLEGLQNGSSGVNPFDLFGGMFAAEQGPGGFFNMFSGGMGGGGFPSRKVNIRKEIINVDLKDIFNEKRLNIKLKQQVICTKCNGSGARSRECVKNCVKCDGSGNIVKIVQLGPGMISQSTSICNYCKGEGKIISDSDKCSTCSGSKYIKKDKKIVIELKNTMLDGEKIHFQNQGDEYIDGGQGHLLFVIRINGNKTFKRNGNDLIIEKEILLSQALSGGNIVIKHLDNKNILLKLNDIITPYSKHKIKGEGMNKKGDLIVIFNVKFPNKLDDKRKFYLKKLLPLAPELNTNISYVQKHIEEIDYSEENNERQNNIDSDNEHVQCAQQ